jgi:NACalpha-BTF3-like transcription factor
LLLDCREKELAAVKINKEDVDVIATEFEVDKKAAERRLREHNGVLMDALKSFL